jgi:pyruvate dehydrogenase E2 component (dihydrolipoamide acetyltransferase)
MHEIIMPRLGLSMTVGTVGKWFKHEGEKVMAGEVILAVESDKTTIDVEAYYSGTLLKILRHEGEEVPVTEVIGYIGEASEKIPQGIPAPPLKPEVRNERAQSIADPEKPVAGGQQFLKISPVARKLAEEKGLDVHLINGTGPGGRIVLEDIERAVTSPSSAGAPDHGGARRGALKEKSRAPLTRMRKVIAERLTFSMQSIPQIMVSVVVDAGMLLDVRQRVQKKMSTPRSPHVTLTDFIIKASAIVLEEQPAVNSALIDGHLVLYEDINVGIAAATANGLIVPTIYSSNTLSIIDIAQARAALLARISAGKHTIDEISNGTFTISNLGMFGIRSFTAIINPPQGAILMVGETYRSAVVAPDNTIQAGTLMQISLAVDHRILDGADAARFLSRMRELLQNPVIFVPAELL